MDENRPAMREDMRNINEAFEVQSRGGGFQMKELLTNEPSQNLCRAVLAVISQSFQQMCGISLVSYYATILFENSLCFHV
jgi:hypothetical protein